MKKSLKGTIILFLTAFTFVGMCSGNANAAHSRHPNQYPGFIGAMHHYKQCKIFIKRAQDYKVTVAEALREYIIARQSQNLSTRLAAARKLKVAKRKLAWAEKMVITQKCKLSYSKIPVFKKPVFRR